MFYYSFNIGDYQSHTSHLSEMEDLAYRRMLDWCYLHEKPLPDEVDEIARQIRMRSHSDCIAVVLREYFFRIDDGWISERVQFELSKIADKSDKARKSAEARWSTKKTNANASETHNGRNAIPIHQDTNTQIHKVRATAVAPPDGVSQSVWGDFVKQRKAKNAEWVKEKQTFAQVAADVARTTVPAPANQDAALKEIMADRKKAVPMPAHIRDQINSAFKRA
jgi:uncharacterized protein YdaU (DUF1376 family)